MAKKTKSYSPNLGLIQGEALMRGTKAAARDIGAQAFTKGFLGVYQASMKEKRDRESKMAKYMADLGNIANVSKLQDGYNKQAVTDFLRSGRDEYAKAADCYERTKDIECLDKMNAIKTSFSNLNSQLENYTNERKEYLTAFDQQQIAHGKSYNFNLYDDIYTNNGQFGIEENGDIGFTTNQGYSKYNDISGKWNVKNNAAEKYILERNSKAIKNGEKGGKFYTDDTRRAYRQSFKNTGPEGIQVLAGTDITGDDEYELADGTMAGNLSFEQMWANGHLADKFYEGRDPDGGIDWMYDDANVDELNGLLAEYYTDVEEYSHGQGEANYVPPKDKYNRFFDQQRDTIQMPGGQWVERSLVEPDMKILQNHNAWDGKEIAPRTSWNNKLWQKTKDNQYQIYDGEKWENVTYEELLINLRFNTVVEEEQKSDEDFDYDAGLGDKNKITPMTFKGSGEGVLDIEHFMNITKGLSVEYGKNNTVILSPKYVGGKSLTLKFNIKDMGERQEQYKNMMNFIVANTQS